MALFVLAGCGPRTREISGSVFIVTQGRTNIKLALVDVNAFQREAAEPILAARAKAIKDQAEPMAERLSAESTPSEEKEQLYAKIKELISPMSYLKGLPPLYAIAKTDADGRFRLTLEEGKAYLITAKASRGLPGQPDEEYAWAVWVQATGNEVMLSNDNMAGMPSPDSALPRTETGLIR